MPPAPQSPRKLSSVLAASRSKSTIELSEGYPTKVLTEVQAEAATTSGSDSELGKAPVPLATSTAGEEPGLASLLWARFPKFVLGFVVTNIVFNTCVPQSQRTLVRTTAFTLSEWYSTFSFVAIGYGIKFVELAKKLHGVAGVFMLYVVVQLLDLAATAGLTLLAFRVVR